MNILHRDIKSENFLVGDAWQIKGIASSYIVSHSRVVCDLGFARKVESLGRKRSMSICGTEEYMVCLLAIKLIVVEYQIIPFG